MTGQPQSADSRAVRDDLAHDIIRRPPRPVTLARVLLALIAVNHVVVPLVALTHIGNLRSIELATHPGYDAGALTRSVNLILARTIAVHLPLLVLTVVLIWKLPSGHPWALRPATLSQGFGIIFSVLSSAPLPALQALIPIVDIIQLTVIVLLWAPRSSRRFFSAARPSGSKHAECRAGDA